MAAVPTSGAVGRVHEGIRRRRALAGSVWPLNSRWPPPSPLPPRSPATAVVGPIRATEPASLENDLAPVSPRSPRPFEHITAVSGGRPALESAPERPAARRPPASAASGRGWRPSSPPQPFEPRVAGFGDPKPTGRRPVCPRPGKSNGADAPSAPALVTDELQPRQDRLLARRHKQARFRDRLADVGWRGRDSDS